jgi:hypothetical protein
MSPWQYIGTVGSTSRTCRLATSKGPQPVPVSGLSKAWQTKPSAPSEADISVST